jgi:hypothetical protein
MSDRDPYVRMLIREFNNEINQYVERQVKSRSKSSALSKLVEERIETSKAPLKWFGDEGWKEMEENDLNIFNLGYWLVATIDARIMKSHGDSPEG